jgi:hypothetical protein
VLLKLGTQTYKAMHELVDEMMAVAEEGAPDALERIVSMYLDLLDVHGAFLQVWGQAGFGDEELRREGMRAKLSTARRMAGVFKKLGWDPRDDDPALMSFAFEVLMDRLWYYERVAGLPANDTEVLSVLTSIISATIGRT